MGRLVDVDDITDSRGAADILGLAHSNAISLYMDRYPDFPRPVISLGRGRCRLWLRTEIDAWQTTRGRRAGPSSDPSTRADPSGSSG